MTMFPSEPKMHCDMTRTYSTDSDRGFAAAGPVLWNSLPSHLKEMDLSCSRFLWSLKTFLFGYWGHGAVWTNLIVPFRNNLTYLLTYNNNSVALMKWLSALHNTRRWRLPRGWSVVRRRPTSTARLRVCCITFWQCFVAYSSLFCMLIIDKLWWTKVWISENIYS